jgi:hypothetical protein
MSTKKMSTKKKKPLSLTVKKPVVVPTSAVVSETDGSDTQKEPAPAAAPPAPAAAPPVDNEPEEIDPHYATREILDYAFKTWAGSFMAPMMYFLTRTFAHHRKGEKYDTGLVFNQLMQINGGDHDALLNDIRTYGETLQAELETFLAGRDSKR